MLSSRWRYAGPESRPSSALVILSTVAVLACGHNRVVKTVWSKPCGQCGQNRVVNVVNVVKTVWSMWSKPRGQCGQNRVVKTVWPKWCVHTVRCDNGP